jgi:CHAT domain-containing protein
LELEAGLSIPNASIQGELGLKQWQKNIRPDEVVFSYYLGEPYSLAWVVDSKSVQVRRIAGKKRLVQWIEQFRKEIMDPSQNGNLSTGMELSQQLFGEYLYSHRTTPFWTMVLDQQLSTLPVAALPARSEGRRFLLEDHSLRILPSALFLKNEAAREWTYRAVGIGDPVFNQADRRSSPLKNASYELLQLNRLPASAREIRRVMAVLGAENWKTNEDTGLAATAATLRSSLEKSPDIVHLSTHFVGQAGSPQLLSIALSPANGQGGSSLFSSLDLNTVRTRTKLVVLSGCSSSTGEVVSSIGINGLSRAFLISGASTVVATLWPTVDNDGPIFPTFYQHLIQQKWSPRAAAESLRAAQLQMIRQGGWTARPSYWAAYLAISKG